MNSPQTLPEKHTIPEMLSRAFWMMIGPMLLVPLTYQIIELGNGWLTAVDFMFLGTLIAMPLARSFEYFKGHPRTSTGEPSTPQHLQRYALGVFALGIPLWIAANVLGNYVVSSI